MKFIHILIKVLKNIQYIMLSSYQCVFKFFIHHTSDLTTYLIDDTGSKIHKNGNCLVLQYFAWSAIFKLLTGS